ncbi:hypothetical protein B0H66DRAFT_541282 [Apodospora peruviana]|uniref:Uncharacterized protein n=1 Tax=Apodospora peruviana TaxID=516989 RepID=A0AAE0IQI8_9PEZI|nr:hypothetical protein B0H66DRAFT_541282 [Apodospora peruviana]
MYLLSFLIPILVSTAILAAPAPVETTLPPLSLNQPGTSHSRHNPIAFLQSVVRLAKRQIAYEVYGPYSVYGEYPDIQEDIAVASSAAPPPQDVPPQATGDAPPQATGDAPPQITGSSVPSASANAPTVANTTAAMPDTTLFPNATSFANGTAPTLAPNQTVSMANWTNPVVITPTPALPTAPQSSSMATILVTPVALTTASVGSSSVAIINLSTLSTLSTPSSLVGTPAAGSTLKLTVPTSASAASSTTASTVPLRRRWLS